MSYVETETVVSNGLSDVDSHSGASEFRQRKKARRTESLQLLSTETEKTRPRKICRRHSYAFRCPEHEIDEDGDDGKHYESVLLVKVFATAIEDDADDSWICCWRDWSRG